MVHSRDKGARFERWVADWFRTTFGTPAHRGQQYKGGPESPDVVGAMPGVHVECKHVERLYLYKAMEQARRDAGSFIPIVISKSNRKPVLVTVALDDLVLLARTVVETLDAPKDGVREMA